MPPSTQSSTEDTTTSAANNNGSSEKLQMACQELNEHLTSITVDASTPSPPPKIEILHAAPQSYIHAQESCNDNNIVGGNCYRFGEGEAYRCKCTFQIVTRSFLVGGDDDDDSGNKKSEQPSTTTNDDNGLIYVTREDGKLVPLPNDGVFPPANVRIRRAMIDLMDCLNRKVINDDNNSNKMSGMMSPTFAFEQLRNNLTSATFVTSWGGGGDGILDKSHGGQYSAGNRGDCLVTLHYGPPGLPKRNCCSDTLQDHWKNESAVLCEECHFTSLTGRSKGIKISVLGTSNRDESSTREKLDHSICEEGIIHDDLWLTMNAFARGDGSTAMVEIERVSLVPPNLLQYPEGDDEATKATTMTTPKVNTHQTNVCVRYQKPATAFQHPNAGVMLTSLHWILNILSRIAKESIVVHDDAKGKTSAAEAAASIQTEATNKPRLLEMYCGCGAHTIPLAKSTFLSEIVAVEIDDRLVNACRNNCRLNHCLKEGNDDTCDEGNCSISPVDNGTFVQVFKGDAAEWAAKTLRRQHKHGRTSPSLSKCNNGSSYYYNNFDILLVDPPRDGLSSTVCDMALKGTFQHIIYVSCGRRALLRDLSILCSSRTTEGEEWGFDVVNLAVIDLFPGTDAVESLVHLRRRCCDE